MGTPFRIAHLSDLHFSQVEFNLSQFLSKRWIGNCNFLLRRKREFNYSLLQSLPALFKEKDVDFVLISGDLTCTASHPEFRKAALFVEQLKKEGFAVALIPGNHDSYTKKAHLEKRFYQYFPASQGKWNLRDHQISLESLNEGWWILLVDTTLATPLLCCHGSLSESIETHIDQALSSLPKEARVIMVNHFPILAQGNKGSLRRSDALLALFHKHPQVKIYLHGHNHDPKVLDLREQNLPICVDAGSASHEKRGGWSLWELEGEIASFQSFRWEGERQCWIFQPALNFVIRTNS